MRWVTTKKIDWLLREIAYYYFLVVGVITSTIFIWNWWFV